MGLVKSTGARTRYRNDTTVHADQIRVYTDGSASPNPGVGGYAAIIVQDGIGREISGGFRRTTNNRMEIVAAIEALKAVNGKGHVIAIYTDSRYLADMFNGGHALKWQSKGWRRTAKNQALNPDLWSELLRFAEKQTVHFMWIKGHAGHPENERCDFLAVEARGKKDLPVDEGYENPFVPENPRQPTLWEFDFTG